MTRTILTGYWHLPLPSCTRGGQHVGTANGVLVYDEEQQLGVFSMSERSQRRSADEAEALLDLAAEVRPEGARSVVLSADWMHVLGRNLWAAGVIQLAINLGIQSQTIYIGSEYAEGPIEEPWRPNTLGRSVAGMERK